MNLTKLIEYLQAPGIIDRLVQRDPEVWGTIYQSEYIQQHVRNKFRHKIEMLAGSANATEDDLIQEGFQEIWKTFQRMNGQVEEPRGFLIYLLTVSFRRILSKNIVKQAGRDGIAKLRTRLSASLEEGILCEEAADIIVAPSAEEEFFLTTYQEENVIRFLERYSDPGVRLYGREHLLEQRTPAQIAARYEEPYEKIKSILYRMKSELKVHLSQQNER